MVLVSIRCLVFNQVEYIRQCLEGIVMQQTNFEFEAIVHDDASTDGTQTIIREYAQKYPNIIKPILEVENQYSKHDGSLRRIVSAACTGKYMAYCEGDDYWTDPLKLQKEVDIMESNPHIAMVYTGFNTTDNDGHVIKRFDMDYYMSQSRSGFVLPYLIYRNTIMTVSCLFRREVYESPYKDGCKIGLDYLSFLCAAASGPLSYIPDCTCSYRRNPSSLTNTQKGRIQQQMIVVLNHVTRLISTGVIPLSRLHRIMTDAYIAAKGLDLWIKGFDKDYLKQFTIRRNILYLIPGAVLEFYHLCSYYGTKLLKVKILRKYQ
jgi:glycosyltransferase involved in cell wall biosynthesis